MPAVEKAAEAFRTISEAAEAVGAPAHVLRFWETRFSFIRPMKRAGGRRFYRPQDLEVLRGVRVLLQDEGYTIKGVQRLHREGGLRRIAAAGRGEAVPPPVADDLEGEGDPPLIPVAALGRLHSLVRDLEAAKARIDAVLAE